MDPVTTNGDNKVPLGTTTKHRGSIHAEESPDLNFTKTPYGNDIFEGDGADSVEKLTNGEPVSEGFLNRTHSKNSYWSSRRDWDLPTMNGKIMRSFSIETGHYGEKSSPGIRQRSTFFSSTGRLSRSVESPLMERTFRGRTPWRGVDNYSTWKRLKYSGQIDNLGSIYPKRRSVNTFFYELYVLF